jgi:uncharacterized glyoxalase superfamily protein PhnB
MHDNATNRTIPRTAHTITPHLVVRGAAQAADWYQQAFGAQAGARIPVPGGKFIQIELLLGDSVVMLADEFPDMGVLSPLSLGGTYGALHITTDNADALWGTGCRGAITTRAALDRKIPRHRGHLRLRVHRRRRSETRRGPTSRLV